MHRRSGQQLKGSGQGAVASGQFLLLAFGEGSVFYRPLITDHCFTSLLPWGWGDYE